MHRKKSEEERIDFFFEVKKWKGKIAIGESDKCSELKWVNLFNLPKDIVPFTLFGWIEK